MGRYEQFTANLTGGLHQDENPAHLEDDELTECTNIALYDTMVGTRPGTVRPGAGEDYETALSEANPIQGMFEYRKNFDEGRVLIAIADHTSAPATSARVFYEDGARLPIGSAAVITAGANNIWTFTEHNNLLVAAGGAAADDVWYWDGNVANPPVTIAIVDSAAARIRPQYVFAWNNYLFINGMRGGVLADNNPSATRYANFAQDVTLASSWSHGNTIGFDATIKGLDTYGLNFSTGFATYRDNAGDWLLMLGNRNITSAILSPASDFAVTDVIANGCVSQRAFVPLGLDSGDGIYLSQHGIHSLRQSQQHGRRADTYLSWKIRSFFATLNRARLKYACGAYDQANGRVIFAVSTGSNTSNDTLLVLDVKDVEEITSKTARWSIWNLNGPSGRKFVQTLTYARDATDNYHLYIGTSTGDVLRFSNTVFSDLDTAYTAKIVSKHRDYGSIIQAKRLGDIMLTLAPGGGYTPTMKFLFDYGRRTSSQRQLRMPVSTGSAFGTGVFGTATFGSASTTSDTKVYGAGSGRTIAFEISHSGKNQPFRIGKIDHQVMLMGEDTGDASAA